jgi:hypothetical protein
MSLLLESILFVLTAFPSVTGGLARLRDSNKMHHFFKKVIQVLATVLRT